MKTINPKTIKKDLVTDKYVVGHVMTKLLDAGKESGIHISESFFDMGSHTHWHTHPNTQILIGKSGSGFVQKKGEKLKHIEVGDIVIIHANEIHWHGAGKYDTFVHIAIQIGDDEGNIIMPLTESEYNEVDNLNK